QRLRELPHALQRAGQLAVVDGDADARGQLGDLALGRLGDVPERARLVEHRGDEDVRRAGRVLLGVELVPDVAEDGHRAAVRVAGLGVGLAVLRLGRAEHALDLEAVVVEGRGDTGARDDVRGPLVQLPGGAAVVL